MFFLGFGGAKRHGTKHWKEFTDAGDVEVDWADDGADVAVGYNGWREGVVLGFGVVRVDYVGLVFAYFFEVFATYDFAVEVKFEVPEDEWVKN